MPAHVTFREDLACVHIRYFDHLTLPQLLDALQQVALTLQEHRVTRLFADCLELRAGPSLSEMYEAVSALRDTREDATSVKQAILLPSHPDASEAVRFWETLGINRGMWVQTFTTREAAMEWLRRD